ncbi:hypothetical protein VTL71DRAFT_16007 [Oculimacula yallundae]|uniref:Heterokaryon incompatibility domain-containing protein n=1 Tax=Oculimacula yallundae TaxID=86028 RepID=A0ABR4CFH5_9HELO
MRDQTQVLRIWADALCINQSNDEKKAQQVANMGEVYQTAARTIIHLGPLTPQVYRNLEYVLRKIHVDWWTAGLGNSYGSIITDAEEDQLNRAWFPRDWVLQELAFPRHPWIQFGSKRVVWLLLCNVLVPLSHNHDKFRDGLNMEFRGVRILQGMAMMRYRGFINEPLWTLLVRRQGLGATDPQGLVYAHMCMASDSRTLDEYASIDYRQEHDVSELYVQVLDTLLIRLVWFPCSSSGTKAPLKSITLTYLLGHQTGGKQQQEIVEDAVDIPECFNSSLKILIF